MKVNVKWSNCQLTMCVKQSNEWRLRLKKEVLDVEKELVWIWVCYKEQRKVRKKMKEKKESRTRTKKININLITRKFVILGMNEKGEQRGGDYHKKVKLKW